MGDCAREVLFHLVAIDDHAHPDTDLVLSAQWVSRTLGRYDDLVQVLLGCL